MPACTGDGVYLYEGENYAGRCRKFTASEAYLDTVAFADIASSIRLVGSYAGGDTKVTLCSDARYAGACSTFAGDDANLGDDGVGNDRASSLLIEPLCSAVTEIPQVECRALVALYNSTDGAHWSDQSGWLATNTPCTSPWFGVRCASGRVSLLDLAGQELRGALPPQLGSLTNLQELYLEGNQLSGTIPPEVSSLTRLQVPWLQGNRLSGAIPPELGSLINLQDLKLGWNQLSGALPPQLGNLNSLALLDLPVNQLSGAIPPQLGNLASLVYLILDHNLLSGPLPDHLRQLTQLQSFHFNDTQLCEPPDPAFQAWLAGIPDLRRTGVKCPTVTVTPTATSTGTRTPTPTATRTPLTGTRRVYLPVILRSYPASITLFSDNFNDGDLAGWTPNGGGGQNTGSAMRGQRADGEAYNMRPESGTDFTYEATVTVHSGAAGLTFRASADGADSDCVALDPAASRVKFCINGPWWYGAAKEMALQYDRAYRLKVVARGASFEVYLDGVKLFTTTSTRHAAGRFGVLAYEGAATFDDVTAAAP